MSDEVVGRREFLKGAAGGVLGSAGMLAGLSEGAFGMTPGDLRVVHEVAGPGEYWQDAPKYSMKFAVCGMSHDHIYGMVEAVQRGGGVLVAAYGSEPDKVAGF